MRPPSPMNPYETEKLVQEYLLFHYGTPGDILPWDFGPKAALDFPRRVVQETFDRAAVPEGARALDIGCAVGQSSFVLSEFSAEVIGIDYSAAFVMAAETMRREGVMPCERLEEAGRISEIELRPYEGANRDRVRFETGDATDLRGGLGRFDVVLAANLVCRLPESAGFLRRLPELVNAGGQLVISTPCTWMEDFTPRDRWPQGETLDLLKGHLSEHFELQEVKDLPMLIREHRRKYQWTVTQASRWVRKG